MKLKSMIILISIICLISSVIGICSGTTGYMGSRPVIGDSYPSIRM